MWVEEGVSERGAVFALNRCDVPQQALCAWKGEWHSAMRTPHGLFSAVGSARTFFAAKVLSTVFVDRSVGRSGGNRPDSVEKWPSLRPGGLCSEAMQLQFRNELPWQRLVAPGAVRAKLFTKAVENSVEDRWGKPQKRLSSARNTRLHCFWAVRLNH